MMKKKFRTYYDAAPPSAWMGPEVSQCVKLWGDVGFMVPWHKPDALENVSFSHKKISSITWHLDKIILHCTHSILIMSLKETQHSTQRLRGNIMSRTPQMSTFQATSPQNGDVPRPLDFNDDYVQGQVPSDSPEASGGQPSSLPDNAPSTGPSRT